MDYDMRMYEREDETYDFASWFLLLIVLVWTVAGIVAFLWSIICFGKSGTMSQQIVGLLLAIFFGPFYWLYYFSVKKYCR